MPKNTPTTKLEAWANVRDALQTLTNYPFENREELDEALTLFFTAQRKVTKLTWAEQGIFRDPQ